MHPLHVRTGKIPDKKRQHKVSDARKQIYYNLIFAIHLGHPKLLREITPREHAFCSIKRIVYSIFSMVNPTIISNKNL